MLDLKDMHEHKNTHTHMTRRRETHWGWMQKKKNAFALLEVRQ